MKDVLFLSQKAEPATQADKQFAMDLLDTLQAHKDGCVGMAANMIGVNKAIIAVNMGMLNVIMFNPRKVISGRYVLKDNYHITRVFIGETDQNGVDAIKRAMDAAVIGQDPVDLSIGCSGYFRKPENAILHMKVDGWKQLLGLDKRLRSAFEGRGALL
ncbi:MAG: peptide deformylase [Clostridiales bacterium]|nr:peptide deformylase [Clostridiales bacterium]